MYSPQPEDCLIKVYCFISEAERGGPALGGTRVRLAHERAPTRLALGMSGWNGEQTAKLNQGRVQSSIRPVATEISRESLFAGK